LLGKGISCESLQKYKVQLKTRIGLLGKVLQINSINRNFFGVLITSKKRKNLMKENSLLSAYKVIHLWWSATLSHPNLEITSIKLVVFHRAAVA